MNRSLQLPFHINFLLNNFLLNASLKRTVQYSNIHATSCVQSAVMQSARYSASLQTQLRLACCKSEASLRAYVVRGCEQAFSTQQTRKLSVKCAATRELSSCAPAKGMKLQGSCHCGAVKFTVEIQTPQPFMHCYCSICRKTQGGSGACINIMVRNAQPTQNQYLSRVGKANVSQCFAIEPVSWHAGMQPVAVSSVVHNIAAGRVRNI